MCTITKNESYNSFEVNFNGKPSEEIRSILKANGYRWHGVRRIWYGYKDITTLLNGEQTTPEQAEPTAKKQKHGARLATLWERTRTDALPKYGTDNEIKKTVEKAARDAGEGYDKHAAAYMRKHLRERFPEVKFSITSGGAGYLYSVDIEIKASPYALNKIKGDPSAYDWRDRYDHNEPSDELAAVLAYCDALHNVFDADDGDDYADYGAHHDLYGGASIAYNYTQTAQTDAIRADIEDFQKQQEKAHAEEEAERLRRVAELMEEQKRQAIEEEKRRKQEEADAAAIMAHIVVKDLTEAEQIAVTDLLSGHGKESTIKEVEENTESIDKSGNPCEVNTTDAIITRQIFFTSAELFGKFSNLFLNDWEFLANKGGSRTVDARITDEATYHKLTAEQRESVHFFSIDCVGVYLDNVLQYVIDPQGFKYARYVFLVSDISDTMTATDYQNRWKEQSEKLKPFYIPAPIAEQLKAADLKEGEEVTILYLDDMLMIAQNITVKLISATAQKYAQYTDAAKIEFIPKGKRNAHYLYIHKGGYFALYRGNLPDIPESVKQTKVNNNCYFVNYAGGAAHDYIKSSIEYYKMLGFEPVINLIAE